LTISALEERMKQSGILQLEDQVFAVEGEDEIGEKSELPGIAR
jgi:hypothetical protein